jgi:aspartate-semialdehyde dehydrogenase
MSLTVAVLGATSLIGREILETLAERAFPADAVIALGSRKQLGREVSMGDRTLRLQDADEFDWSGADICFVCVGEKSARRQASRIAATGCLAVDLSAAFRGDPEIPLVAPEVNPEAVEGWRARRILSVPSPAAAQIAAVLAPLHQAATVRRAIATVLSPASEAGQEAMDELWTQTKGLYVNQGPEPKAFAKQIAFNIIPQVGDVLDDGATEAEAGLRGELMRLIDPDLDASATFAHVPVFVGLAAAVHVELASPLPASAVRAMLREAPGLMVVDNREEETFISPLETVGEWATFVSRIRDDPALPNGLALWIASDNLRKGAALNAVQLAETLMARGAFAGALN